MEARHAQKEGGSLLSMNYGRAAVSISQLLILLCCYVCVGMLFYRALKSECGRDVFLLLYAGRRSLDGMILQCCRQFFHLSQRACLFGCLSSPGFVQFVKIYVPTCMSVLGLIYMALSSFVKVMGYVT